MLVGVAVSVPAALLLMLVANVLPLEPLLPSTVRATGPVSADGRALFWIGFFLLSGLIVAGQGAHGIRYGTGSRKRLAVTLALGASLLAAGLTAHALR